MAFELSTAWRSAGKGHDLYDLVALVVLFEVCYRLFGRLLAKLATVDGFARDSAKRGKLAAEGASYLVSFVHAFVVAVRGAWHLWSLRGAPADARFRAARHPPSRFVARVLGADRGGAAGRDVDMPRAVDRMHRAVLGRRRRGATWLFRRRSSGRRSTVTDDREEELAG